jgi:hypothetical protein
MKCPACGSEAMKVLYLGLPMKLCSNESCNCLFGFFSRVAVWIPISDGECFCFLGYEGSYWKALWHWLTCTDYGA